MIHLKYITRICIIILIVVRFSESCVTTSHDFPQKELNFKSKANEIFYIPTDNDYLTKFAGHYTFARSRKWQRKVSYFRSKKDIVARGKARNCTSTLDVLAWLMDMVNAKHGLLMLAYGQLIHIHREKEFVDKKGGYLDDDIDTWASLETVLLIANLEKDLFTLFGWTVRAFVHIVNGQNYVVCLQVVATCGHNPIVAKLKASAAQPVIDIYPFPLIQANNGEDRVFKDLWSNNIFAESMIYPPKCINFVSNGTSYPLHLQLPRNASGIIECLYGNWHIPSKRQGMLNFTCMDSNMI